MRRLNSIANRFHTHWETATDDNNLTLYGFRRFKTTHLLNLRFLEDEIASVDHKLYQAGLSLGTDHSTLNRLGLKYCQKDSRVPEIEDTITDDFIRRVRDLIKQYGVLCLSLFTILYCI